MRWETVPLGSLIHDVATGFASRDDLDEGVFQIRMNNLTSDSHWDWSKRRRVTPSARQLSSSLVEPGDVVFNATNSPDLVGKSGLMPLLDEPAVISNHFLRLRTRADLLVPAYLQHWLVQQFAHGIFRAKAKTWINQATLDRSVLLALRLPLPPLPEQRRIAAILDEADALRAKRRRTTALLNDIPAVVFDSYDKSRWDVATLADVAHLQGGITLNARRGALPAKANYLRVANVFRGSIDLSELKETGVTDREIARTRLQVDDVLVVEGHGNRAEVGRAALIETPPDEELTHQNHLFRLRPITGRVTGRVLELALNCARSREYFRRVANTTSGLNTLNATNVRALSLRVPPIGMQQAIAADVERARSARGSAQQHESHLDGLFASLQHRAFRGEL